MVPRSRAPSPGLLRDAETHTAEPRPAETGTELPPSTRTLTVVVDESAPPPENAALALTAGELIVGRFRLERRLGQGGMGVVWAARHLVTRKAVALKFLNPTTSGDVEKRQRFLREARAASAVRHPNVVDVHDVVELPDGSPVMDRKASTSDV